MTVIVRIATFNLENLDDPTPQALASNRQLLPLDARLPFLRPALARLRADILCLQEVHGQRDATAGPFELRALDRLLQGTRYQDFARAFTTSPAGAGVMAQRNLVVLSNRPIAGFQQHLDPDAAPEYRPLTEAPPTSAGQPTGPRRIVPERPLLHAQVQLPDGRVLHVLNLHLKSKAPRSIRGQQDPQQEFMWLTASGWAEGMFISSMMRVGQAIETRRFVDGLFDADPGALIVVCGDLNADLDEVPLLALRGDVENTSNPALAGRVLVPCERTVPESARFSLYHQGRGAMLDHVLVSRPLLECYRGTEIHNEVLHDESAAFAGDDKYPESDHAPVVATFELPD